MKTVAGMVVAAGGLIGLFFGLSSKAIVATETTLQQQIVAKEREELDSLKGGNLEAFGNLFADDAVFIDPHGFAGKAEVLKHTAAFRIVDYSMDDVKVISLGPKSGLIAYQLNEKATSHGKEFSTRAYASAIWTEHGGRWICTFTQETPAK